MAGQFNKKGGGKDDGPRQADRRFASSFFSQTGVMDQVVINKDNELLEKQYQDMQNEMDD